MDAEMQGASDNIDRISYMPDPILVHVLSFLGAREAVQTCILSKRWTDLWAYLPCLKFDSEEFGYDEIFKGFVSSFLLLRKTSQLDTLKIRWKPADYGDDVTCITSWIVYALRCKPRLLSIYAPSYRYTTLPHSIFCATTLEELNLRLDYHAAETAILPRSINLPLLRKLSLTSLNVAADFLQKLLLGCPLLEELQFQDCTLPTMKISSALLKQLTIIQCTGDDMFISCSNLTSLQLVEIEVDEIVLRNLSSLKHAFLYLPFSGFSRFEILSGLSNATEVELFGTELKTILAKELPNCSTFKNLKQLVLDQCLNSGDLDIMERFRQCSPNLDVAYFSYHKEELLKQKENKRFPPQYIAVEDGDDDDDDFYDDFHDDFYDDFYDF